MDDLVLVSAIRARMGLDRNVSDDRIDVAAADGVVTISANVRYVADAERVKELALGLPGVRDVRSNIGARWRG